jgi:putative IMPACT (imprinted ancient) family translation regulator
MTKIDIKMPSKADLMRSAMAEAEKLITRKARDAAARHGCVSLRFSRKPDGSIRAVEFQGSEGAIKAATAGIGS